MTEWKEVELQEIAEVQTGPFGSQLKNEQYVTGGTPVVTVEHLQDFRIIDFDYPSVTEEDKNRLSKYLLKQDDIVFTRVGSVDLSAFVKKHQDGWMFSSRMLRVRANPVEVDSRFLSYYFQQKSFRDYILNISVGATMPSINTEILKTIPVSYPYLPEQKAIAEILSSLDDKIDLLHRQNATLEKMAETLFRQWFVEEAKEEWEIGTLDEILTVKGGTTPSTSEPAFWNGTIHWTSPRDITNLNGIYLFDTERKITELGLSKISSGLLPKGTLLMSSRAPVGVLAFSEVPVAINQGYIAILDDKGYSKEFIYLWLKINIDTVHSFSNGSTFMEVSKSAFKSIEIQIPPMSILREFQFIVKPYFEKIKTNQTQIRTLTALGDTLLPKLMNGEVRVL
ncbi:MAG: restriction endonuclease subunit S [Bacteroidales bacterium]|nr:restriction endonuclease subunit S [Bacteroidales bacterium]